MFQSNKKKTSASVFTTMVVAPHQKSAKKEREEKKKKEKDGENKTGWEAVKVGEQVLPRAPSCTEGSLLHKRQITRNMQGTRNNEGHT